VNPRALFIARRALGPDVELAATGTLRPVPFGSLLLVVGVLIPVVVASTTRSGWAVAVVGLVLAIAAGVVVSGRNLRVLLAVRGGMVEVHRLTWLMRTHGPLAEAPHRDLSLHDKGRSMLLYLAPAGCTEIGGLPIAVNHPLD
jgi:hypothetical protein